jgi:hypothetical protein
MCSQFSYAKHRCCIARASKAKAQQLMCAVHHLQVPLLALPGCSSYWPSHYYVLHVHLCCRPCCCSWLARSQVPTVPPWTAWTHQHGQQARSQQQSYASR